MEGSGEGHSPQRQDSQASRHGQNGVDAGAITPTEQTAEIIESDFQSQLATLESSAEQQETLDIKCDQCGAETAFTPGQTAGRCPFCGNPIVANTAAMPSRSDSAWALLPLTIRHQSSA